MSENVLEKSSANLLQVIIRSIDKRLDYRFVDSIYDGRVLLQLTARGREGSVSVRTEDLRKALLDDGCKNAVRQKIKGVRDHLLSNYVVDVMGRRISRMLKQSASGSDDNKSSFFYRRPQGRR